MSEPSAPALILASESASRRALLTAAGLTFETRPARIDEAAIKESARAEDADPVEAAVLLAELKAQRIARREPGALVIAADQILVCDDQWYDKPASVDEARRHLLALRGKTHTLVTSVLCQRGETRLWHHIAQPKLTMRNFSDAFLEAHLAAEGDEVMRTVGAYRLEHGGAQLFDRIEGDYFSILGLPLLPLLGFLRQHRAIAS